MIVRLFWVAAGLASTALGLVGAVLPLLPTVPFMILAAFCFAKGSRRLHSWIVERSPFSPTILDWMEHGAISRRAKKLATGAMLASLLVPVAVGMPWAVVAGQAFVLALVAAFVLTRPSPPLS